MKTAKGWPRALLAFIFLLAASGAEARTPPGFQLAMSDALPAVVHIQSLERPLRPPGYPNPQQYFFGTPAPQGSSVFPLGTGFLIRPQGYCVTSYQVIEGAQKLEVVTANKRRFKASLVGGDRSLDLALLKLEGAGGTRALDFAESDKAQLGDFVVAIGQGLGFKPFLSSGLLAAKGHILGSGAYDRHFVLDFPTHPGNAGGPVLDARGRVLGMASFVPNLPAHFGFVLPSKLLQESVRDLIRHGKLVRPWLGVVVKHLNSVDSIAEVYDPSIRSGLLIENLIVDGPAANAGLQVGDLLVSAGKDKNQLNLREIAQLQDLLGTLQAGQKLEFKIFRRKQGLMTVNLTLGELPSAIDLPVNDDLL